MAIMASIRNSKTMLKRWTFATFGEMPKSPPQIRVIITIHNAKPTTKRRSPVVPWRICCIEKNDAGTRGRRVHIEKTGWRGTARAGMPKLHGLNTKSVLASGVGVQTNPPQSTIPKVAWPIAWVAWTANPRTHFFCPQIFLPNPIPDDLQPGQ